MIQIRQAVPNELPRIMEIYHIAQDYMIASGNPDQWRHSHPGRALIEQDIRDGSCYVLCDETGIRGVFALIMGADATYARIDGGNWLNDEPYVTIHRIASDGTAHGIVSAAVGYALGLERNVRADTHEDNKTMQHTLEKNGFVRCGIIYLENGDPRIAYHLAC